MSKSKKDGPAEKFKSKIGGQAVIEGVMMRGIDKAAMACRLPSGEIDLEQWELRGTKAVTILRRIPFVRGVFVFISSMIEGYKCISRSADKQMQAEPQDDEEQTRLEKWLDEKVGDKLMPIITTFSILLGLALAVAMFILLPSGISKLIDKYIVSLSPFVKNVIEGVIKIGIFIGYTSLTALMKDIRRTYEYHGAEHKTIACYEHGETLTVENVKKHCRFHPRCGTSFIFLVLFISIFVSTIFRVSWASLLVRVLVKIALLPVVMGISYEIIRIAGKYDCLATRIISAPGLWIQRITTREPDDEEIMCAIKALEVCIPDDPMEDRL